MEDLKGIFIGYKNFVSKKSNKPCYIISMLFITLEEDDSRADYLVKDIFVNEKDYNNFVNEHQILASVDVKREIVRDEVRYYI